jgi:hypothetical protein
MSKMVATEKQMNWELITPASGAKVFAAMMGQVETRQENRYNQLTCDKVKQKDNAQDTASIADFTC